MSKLGLVKDVLKGAKEAKPFFSAADKAAMELQRGKGTGKEFITELKKAPGIKAAELEHRKLGEIESMPKMTKEEFLKELEKRPPQAIEETVLRNPTEQEWNEIADRMMEKEATDITNDEIGRLTRYNREDWNEFFDDTLAGMEYRRGEFLDDARRAAEEGELPDSPKYETYKLPGAENYREILLRMPDPGKELKAAQANLQKAKDLAFTFKNSPTVMEDLAKAEQRFEKAKAASENKFMSSHWDQPNILAHIRASDRVGPNGEKVLHIEEIQSDWHQKGRKQGYREAQNTDGWTVKSPNPYEPNEVIVYDQNGKAVWTGTNNFGTDRQIIDKVSARLQEDKVPDAPFKKNWHELAMKRMLNYAAENGYDKIAITPGAEQASRYDLSKHINGINWNTRGDGLYNIEAESHRGEPIVKKGLTPEQLEDTVGKEVAQKIVEGVGQFQKDPLFDSAKISRGRLENLDLQVGGEGMKGFYDKILPDYLNNFGKKYGVSVGAYDIPNPKTGLSITDLQRQRGLTEQQWLDLTPDERMALIDETDAAAKANVTPLHTFDITPEMREELKGGTPLYQKIGIPAGAGAAGAESMDQEEPGFASGGIVGEEYDPDQSDGGLINHETDSFKRGGRVKISDNPDAMFLELRDKELNRK